MHRLMVTSAVYRQAGTAGTAPLKVDAENTLLWHWRPNRQRPKRSGFAAGGGEC